MSRADELRGELELAELEDELVKAKAKKSIKPDELREIKDKVRAARQKFRESRETARVNAADAASEKVKK